MQKNSIKNVHLDLILRKEFIPAAALVTGQVSGASTALTAAFGSGTPNLVALSGTHVPAIKLAATTDEIDFVWSPAHFDNTHRLLIRYLWTSDYSTANGTATFVTLYNANLIGAAPATGATALTIAHTASTKTAATARATYWSTWGALAPLATGAQAGQTFDPTVASVSFNTKVSGVTGITIGTDFVYVLGVEIAYTPLITFGYSTREARLLADGRQANLEAGAVADF